MIVHNYHNNKSTTLSLLKTIVKNTIARVS